MDGEGGIVMVMEGRDREGGERGWGEGEEEFKKGNVLLPLLSPESYHGSY